jgi:streptogramin lyase
MKCSGALAFSLTLTIAGVVYAKTDGGRTLSVELVGGTPGATNCSIGAYEFDPPGPPCVGDCNGDGQVTVNEVLTMVNIALGNADATACANGIPSGAQVDVALVLTGVNNALNGCPTPTPTSTPTPTPTPTPTRCVTSLSGPNPYDYFPCYYGEGCLQVEAPNDCCWVATVDSPRVAFPSGNSGCGNGNVCFDLPWVCGYCRALCATYEFSVGGLTWWVGQVNYTPTPWPTATPSPAWTPTAVPSAQAVTFTEYDTGGVPEGITAGSDGNLWFTEATGSFDEHIIIPTVLAAITGGPDGNLWFVRLTAMVGKLSTTGSITEYAVPYVEPPDDKGWIGKVTSTGSFVAYDLPATPPSPLIAAVTDITAGPDGNLWFTEWEANRIGKITSTGSVTEYAVPTSLGEPIGITAGPDGNLWFSEWFGNQIGKITTAGSVTEYGVPTANSFPQAITAGPDGNLWFTECYGNKIGKITTAGSVTEYGVPSADSCPHSITTGPDGNLWFTEPQANKIGRVTPAGDFTEYVVPTANSYPHAIALGLDGNLWFTESRAKKIGRIATPQ